MNTEAVKVDHDPLNNRSPADPGLPQRVCVYLYSTISTISIQEKVPATDAAVDTAQGHGDTEAEEVALVKMADTVIQPRWGEPELRRKQKTLTPILKNTVQ